jgi:hypothetical protein
MGTNRKLGFTPNVNPQSELRFGDSQSLSQSDLLYSTATTLFHRCFNNKNNLIFFSNNEQLLSQQQQNDNLVSPSAT